MEPNDRDYDHSDAVEATKPKEKWRANYLPAPHFYNLNQACALIKRAFDATCYLVGSSLERRDYRDVDVRLILDDDAYDRFFRAPDAGWLSAYWSLTCTSLSLWLRQQSDLPIDFQIQRQTQANANHDRKAGTGTMRSALGHFLDYPGEVPGVAERAAPIQAEDDCANGHASDIPFRDPCPKCNQ